MRDIVTVNPATEETLQRYPLMSQESVDQIIEEMHVVQKQWHTTDFATRKQHLLNLATLLEQQKEVYSQLISNEMGKPITQAVAEIEKCVKLCQYYADNAEKQLQPEIIQTEYQKSYRTFQPLGIIFAIMPWNFPFWQVMRFAVPNLMLGNAGLLKHSPNTMGCALAIEYLFTQAGFPKNLFRSLVIDVDLAPFVIRHPHVAGITLTGSNRAGQAVAKEAGEVLKKVVLELGGSDPYVVLADADLDQAAEQCVLSRLNNTGQVCIAAKRIIAVKSIAADLEKRILEKAQAYQMGNPLETNTKLGPMARADLRDKLHEQVLRSVASGAQCVLGGEMPTGKGYYYPATILSNVTADSPAFHEELFGPVICLTQAADEQEALQLANQTEFGLAGAIFTRDIKHGEQLAKENLIAGTCAVNVLVATDPRLPFGGIKQSGYGRELSIEGLREFANIKTIIIS